MSKIRHNLSLLGDSYAMPYVHCACTSVHIFMHIICSSVVFLQCSVAANSYIYIFIFNMNLIWCEKSELYPILSDLTGCSESTGADI